MCIMDTNKIRKIVLVLSLLLVAVGLFPAVGGLPEGAVPVSERAALVALYKATDGENWINRAGWKDGTLEKDGFAVRGTEAQWYGISVKQGHVRHIRLNENRLIGRIPAEVGDPDGENVVSSAEIGNPDDRHGGRGGQR